MPESARSNSSAPSSGWSQAIFTSGWLWGGMATVAFYCLLPYLPDEHGQLKRYFSAHWIEYTTTGLFLVGMASLLIRACTLPFERDALNHGFLQRLAPIDGESATECAARITTSLQSLSPRFSLSSLGKRIFDTCSYVIGKRSADGLEAHLNYLADTAAVRLNGSYAFIRTITWAIPILGFLGTVIGITMSIANITPDQLESSLDEVTAGLAVAFDTTALSLALSMVLVFSTFFVERQEQQVLDAVEDAALQSLVSLFPSPEVERPEGPLLQAEQLAAEQLLARTESFVTWQMETWQSSLESVRSRWQTTLEQQQRTLDEALESGFQTALADHAQQLAETRHEFLEAFRSAAQAMQQQLSVTQETIQLQQATHQEELQATWNVLQTNSLKISEQQTRNWQQFSEQLQQQILQWQEQFKLTQDVAAQQLQELQDQGRLLLQLSEQEHLLIRLEDRLAQNLETVRVVDTLDETLLSLNAAVNLLSAKTRQKAA